MSAPKDDGGPAFPIPDQRGQNGEGICQGCDGMSLRVYLAAKAPHDELNIPSLCPADVRDYLGEKTTYGNFPSDNFPSGNWKGRVFAKARYEWADAMLVERAKGKP